MQRNPEVDRDNGRPRQSSIALEHTDPDADKRTAGRYAVVDTHTHDQHRRGLSKARAESLAREYAEGIVARRERPDPHWFQRGGEE